MTPQAMDPKLTLAILGVLALVALWVAWKISKFVIKAILLLILVSIGAGVAWYYFGGPK